MKISAAAPVGVDGLKSAAITSPVEELGGKFGEMLNSLAKSEIQTNNLAERLSMGENVDLHTLMIGMEQTDIQFKVAMAIRDKLVEAYREVMRMQV